MQVSLAMQWPLFESQMVPAPAPQSAVDSQRSLGWQKPAALQLSPSAHDESLAQPQRPVAASQVKPGAHWVSPVQRFFWPPLQAGSPAVQTSAAARSARPGAFGQRPALRGSP